MQETSVNVIVTTKRMAGSLPVNETLISWQLVHIHGDTPTTLMRGQTKTGDNGLAHISLKVDPSQLSSDAVNINDDTQLALVVVPSKMSDGSNNEIIYHHYLCDDETFECPGSGYAPEPVPCKFLRDIFCVIF